MTRAPSIRPFACLAFLCAAMPAYAQDVQAPSSAGPQPAAPVASTLPGGAASLNEQHGDWTITCGMTPAGKRCFFSQVLGDSQTGQRALSVELQVAGAERVDGMLLAPLSLRLDAGVNLAVDGRPLQGPIPFLACIPQGCLVPITFEGEVFAALKAGTTLQFSATPLGSPEPIELPISLTGFTAASSRTAELAN